MTRFAGYGQMFRMMGERLTAEHEANPPLADKPAVQLQRPFMIVPGWTTRKAELEPLGHKLTQDGRNGGHIAFVQNGEFFADEACTQALTDFSPDQKVFQTVLTDIRMPPPLAAVEVAKNLEAVQQLTGSDKIDVTGFSMGGLATRVYLDRGGSAIGKFMLLGTPNQGTTFANLARQVLERDIKFAISMAGLTPGDLPALEWLSVESGNPHLQELNRHWDRQAAQVETTLAVGGRGLLTPSRSGIGITLGDGLVEADGMAPPGGAVKILEG
ncbi:MAG: hypothetical protein KC910_31700, partial [Candidatus Eremiobacteraeota bacterium]|nr:hypothetical protein [Candidatus Eremiobacteraeota bacterium]